MSTILSILISIVALAAVNPAACASIAKPTKEFQLYAYGKKVGGIPLFSDGEGLYAGNFSSFKDTEAVPVVFTDHQGTWSCSPNTTAAAQAGENPPDWANHFLAIPDEKSSSRKAELVNSTEGQTEKITNGFTFYGSVAFTNRNGRMSSMWYGTLMDNGAYELSWNETGKKAVRFTVKLEAPVNAS